MNPFFFLGTDSFLLGIRYHGLWGLQVRIAFGAIGSMAVPHTHGLSLSM
jgi:hypothetical protein